MRLITLIANLLISLPCALTFFMAIFEFYTIFSNRVTKEDFFRIRKKLAKIRWILNIIAIVGIFLLKLYLIAIICAVIMLNIGIIDIVFYFLEKMIMGDKR